MLFRAGDDLLARIRASLLRRNHDGRRTPPAAPEPRRMPMAQITYYGRLGEMGHHLDRADDFGPGDPLGEHS